MFSQIVSFLNKIIVSIYKSMGFIVLIVIVGGMLFYLASTGFYMFNNSWVIPTILSPSNDKVVAARFKYLEYFHQLGRLETELVDIKQQHEHLSFAQDLQKNIQRNLTRALIAERKRANKDLAALNSILESHKSSKIASTTSHSYGDELAASLQSQLDHGLIDNEEFLRSHQMLNQWTMSRLSHQEKLTDFENRTSALQRNVQWLQDLQGLSERSFHQSLLTLTKHEGADLETLRKEQPLYASAIESSELMVKSEVLKKRSLYLEKIIGDYRETLKKLEKNPYLRASHSPVVVAFVPYANLDAITAGTAIVGCYLEFIFCKQVGKVDRVLDGEVTFQHPLNGHTLRGQLIEIAIADNSWTKSHTLLTHRSPFLF